MPGVTHAQAAVRCGHTQLGVSDMTFLEDYSRVRRGHAAEHPASLRRVAWNNSRRDQSGKRNQAKIRRARWNDEFRAQLRLGT